MPRVFVLFICAAAALGQQQREPAAIEYGFEQRVRNENWNNIVDYGDAQDDEREQIRYRTRAWMKAPLGHSIDFQVGFNQETCQKMGQKNRFDEVVLESAYLDFKRLFVDGLALRVGRQNLTKGEGFVMFEGTPWDGSRTIYFNAVDLSYTRGKSKLELIGILNPARDRMLPRFHDQHKMLIEWDESALGAYFTDTRGAEAYYFYKRETNSRLQPDRHIHTVGGRVVRRPRKAWTATAEFAGQWGFERPAADIRAWGGYAHVKRALGTRAYVLGGAWGMSGDDPATKDRIEGWDPLFARWPKFAEGYLYSLMREKGPGYWTNMRLWQAELGSSPRKWMGLRLTYYRMDAFHPSSVRGDDVQARWDFNAGTHWKGHALYERHLPGNFHRSRDAGWFARFELSYVITGRTHIRH